MKIIDAEYTQMHFGFFRGKTIRQIADAPGGVEYLRNLQEEGLKTEPLRSAIDLFLEHSVLTEVGK